MRRFMVITILIFGKIEMGYDIYRELFNHFGFEDFDYDNSNYITWEQ